MSQKSSEPVYHSSHGVQDLEIKDANIIFNTVWNELEAEVGGVEKMRFPKEIFWLNGAPGAGKGTNTSFIMQYRDFTGAPIIISELLTGEEAKKRIDAGLMVGDREVFNLLLRKLMDPAYLNGAVVDGFPRTKVQVECLKLFYNKLLQLRVAAVTKLEAKNYIRKPHFHIIVLFIDEAESVKRQLARGTKAISKNNEVKASGVGQLVPIRKTDLDPEAARNRYRTFKEVTYDALQSLNEVFHYHYINACGTVQEVQDRIIEELKYQSSLELNQHTFDRLTKIPLASNIARHARQQLVHRLDDYELEHTELFKQVVAIISEKFMPVIHRHAISGNAIINTEDAVFHEPIALAMLIDIFSERGYNAVIDVRQKEVPESVDKETFKIKTKVKKVYRVLLKFQGSQIRRGR